MFYEHSRDPPPSASHRGSTVTDTDRTDHRLDLLQINSEVCRTLNAVAPLVDHHLGAILDDFYRHLGGFDETRTMLCGRSAERLKQAQQQHWQQLFAGVFDDRYRQHARAVGHAHERTGLQPTWYIGGYGFILARLIDIVITHHRRNPRLAVASVQALIKAVLLDMDIAISVYIQAGDDKRQHQTSAIADRVEAEVQTSIRVASEQGERLDEAVRQMKGSMAALGDTTEAVSAAAAETSANVETIAAAGEQLTASVTEISRQVGRAQETSRTAVQEVSHASHTIEALAAAAEQIGQVVKLISSVASQTNLLALNAAIEAARAGTLGNGFAVVASEVKLLASQTSRATKEIASQVAAIQSRTTEAVAVMERIATVIGTIDRTSTAIAAAIEEQTAATAEIGRNVNQAAVGTREGSRLLSGIAEEVRALNDFAAIVQTSSQATMGSLTDLERRVGGLIDGLRTYQGFDRAGAPGRPGTAQVRFNGTACPATLLALSEGGAALGLDAPPPLDYSLQLTIPGLGRPLTGRVVDSTPGRCHVRFPPGSLDAREIAKAADAGIA